MDASTGAQDARGGKTHEKNVSAEEAAQKKGAWLHEAYVRQKRQKGFSSQESKGQKETFPLTSQTTKRAFVVFLFYQSGTNGGAPA